MTRQQITAKLAHLKDKVREDRKELEEDLKTLSNLQDKLNRGEYE